MPQRSITRPPRRVAFGTRVRALHKARGFSQESFADHAGLHRTYIGSVERGERNVTLDENYEIYEALGVHARDLLG